jgi:TonB family protein
MPPEWRYDTPPKPRGTVTAVYPYELLRDEIDGKAKVVILVDERGRVAEVQVKEASRPEFGAALAAALEVFAFDPALRDSKPTATILAMELSFERNSFKHEGLVEPEGEDLDLLHLEQKHPEKIASLKIIDAPPKAISQRAPLFPGSLAGQVQHGQAVIEFLIDEEGVARLPRVVSASDPAFGYAGVQAVAQWRFAPVTAGGKKAVTRVRVPLVFSNAAPAHAAAAPESKTP